MTILKLGRLLTIIYLLTALSCNKPKIMAIISVTEQSGLERNLEYVHLGIPMPKVMEPSERLVAVSSNGVSIPVQLMDTIKKGDLSIINIVFPVTMGANEKKKFRIELTDGIEGPLPESLSFSRASQYVENKYFKIHFASKQDKRGGQILNVVLKEFNDQVLERNHNVPIHWAPNFSKSDSKRYFTMEHLSPSSTNVVQNAGPYTMIKMRSGETDSIPEMHVEGKYIFYAGLPYFEFTSTMTVKEEVNLKLLRNDEMTMDSLFTNLIFSKPDKTISNLKLYDTELDILEKEHMSDQAPWLAFYHKDKEYGFGSIRLEYDNTNVNGELSPLYEPYTKISKSVGNGRYWNRILVEDTNLRIPKGSRYHEKNAYLIFKVDSKEPEKEIEYYSERLNHPLIITVEVNK